MNTEKLVLKYFQSWKEKGSLNEMNESLYLKINSGFFESGRSASFIGFLEEHFTPWNNITLISSFFSENFAAILYEGVNAETNQKMRVSEHLTISKGKIKTIETVEAQVV
ncbi:MAG: hypothetical protein ABJR05_08045 [Balneola sp.]